ncbi:transcriptional regulator [Streptomyces sp. CB02613]|uniref:ArsR/SmtB family transcription factor n=1 Tax=Streptomyces parvus TaxID=66428 RepID=UPI000C27D630|nr:transcriptional regulator [Streptomyces sp. CB02613]
MSSREESASAPSVHQQAVDDKRLLEAAGVFALLADATRLHLLWLLAQEEADVGTLSERCGASRTGVSQHLAKLRLAGLVDTRREGRHVVYRLTDGHLRRLVVEALSHADHRVTGAAPHD